MVEKAGQMKQMFKGATFPLTLLEVFDEPTNRTAWYDSFSKMAFMAWTTALAPAS